MRRSNLSVISILDSAARLVPRVAAPWLGTFWLMVLPLRLLQVYFYSELVRLDDPSQYLYFLWHISICLFAAFVIALFGRAVFVRACFLAQDTERKTQLSPLKVPLSDFLPFLYTALLIEVVFFSTLVTFVIPPLLIILSGLAAASSYGMSGPRIFSAPFGILRLLKHRVALFGISCVFLLALYLVYVNLYFLIQLLLWLSAPLLGPSLPKWEYIFGPGESGIYPKHPLTGQLLFALATMIVEPFWLAANVELVQRSRARVSGEDLKLWFREIKNKEAAR
jgi:hypothetical protein